VRGVIRCAVLVVTTVLAVLLGGGCADAPVAGPAMPSTTAAPGGFAPCPGRPSIGSGWRP
jgi:hypothetical protein